MTIPTLPLVLEEEQTPLVTELLEIIHNQNKVIESLTEEIARLKDLKKGKPASKPSTLEKAISAEIKDNTDNKDDSETPENPKRRPGSAKRKKTEELDIHETKNVAPEYIPDGSRLKDHQEYVVQDIKFELHNTLYRLERWETPDGSYVVGKLPGEVSGMHFGVELRRHIIYEYHHNHVTQPLLLEQLRDMGVDISSGQLSRIITEDKEEFHTEKKEILLAGLGISDYVNVDDTTARHNGTNGHCTHIGNEHFAWFESTDSKSRINFIELLSVGNVAYLIDQTAICYMMEKGIAQSKIQQISRFLIGTKFNSEADWKICLECLGLTSAFDVRIATEGVLIANLIENGFNRNMAIISDDAGQFDLLLCLHSLCWLHTERNINKLVGFNAEQREALERKQSEIWAYYQELKEYKASPSEDKKAELESRFDEIFKGDTRFDSLNKTLLRIHGNKSKLLLVLDRPDIPLHNNLSENDIRDYVKKRKISGSTRSDNGKRCRDTFASLKKTCRKLGISFWEYLKDRLTDKNEIPYLPDLIISNAQKTI